MKKSNREDDKKSLKKLDSIIKIKETETRALLKILEYNYGKINKSDQPKQKN